MGLLGIVKKVQSPLSYTYSYLLSHYRIRYIVACKHIKQTMIKTKTINSTDLELNNEALDDLLHASSYDRVNSFTSKFLIGWLNYIIVSPLQHSSRTKDPSDHYWSEKFTCMGFALRGEECNRKTHYHYLGHLLARYISITSIV